MRRIVCGLAMVLALTTVVSCGSGSEVSTAGEEPVPASLPEGMHPPGSEIADGLVVPEGAHLAGAALPDVLGDDVIGWTASLPIDGDPFAVWTNLVEQVRALHPEPAFPGSADACEWRFEGGEELIDDDDDAATQEAARARKRVTAEDPGLPIEGVECMASAIYEPHTAVGLSMRAGVDSPPIIQISAQDNPYDLPSGTVTVQMSGRRSGEELPSLDAVPPGAIDLLPDTEQPRYPKVGEPFGSEVNCFEGGQAQTTVPPGAEVLVEFAEYGTTSILAVDDARAAIEAFHQQFTGGYDDYPLAIEEAHLPDGGTVLSASHAVSAGGGGCGVSSSPDGRFLRIYRNAD